MENSADHIVRLAACRDQPGASLGTDAAGYEALIERLRASDAMAGAPALGDVAADFALPDPKGRLQRLTDLLAEGPAVLSFNRGSWCPFCAEEVRAWSENRDALIAAGGRLIIVTPETGGRLAGLAQIAGQGVTVLCDPDLGVALRYGLAFPVGLSVLQQYRRDGFDLAQAYGCATGLLPTPATFVLDGARQVHFAFVEPDFRQRAAPAAVLSALYGLTRRS
ncbi:peroxiredoxin [Cypionkella aquatica]|uniref:Peroxiredoxin n=1 Tax=Cypionkella aquatica TaxID=1756042 RepID=A0AA37U2N4_9RHOB|nr:peroxiredoxin-like family protein [Cypionkella aquatica]GLS86199.1 peroxiredoxin [Cypionkella aquatica]